MDNAGRPVGRRLGRREAAVRLAVVGAVLLAGCAGQPAAPTATTSAVASPTGAAVGASMPTPGPSVLAPSPPATTAAATATMGPAAPPVAPTGMGGPAGAAATIVPPTVPPSAGSIWAERAPLLEPNSELAVAELDGAIYALGGYPATRVYVATVQVYNARADRWAYGPPLPQPLHHPVAAAVGGRLYVFGGEVSPTGVANQGVFLDTVYAFDPTAGAWTRKAPMPTARSAGAAAVVDGKVYVAGGRPPRGRDFAVYDPATDAWATLPDLPTQRNHLAAAAIGGKVYVVGGRFGGGVGSEMTDAVEIYDPAAGAWARAAPMPTRRAGVNGIAARGCLYVFGGEGNDAHPRGLFPQVEVYDPRTDAWRSLEPIPTPVHGVTGAAYLDGWIHLPGGGVARGGNSGTTIHQAFRAVVSCETGDAAPGRSAP